MKTKQEKPIFKIIFVGNSGVGKTQILSRFNTDVFNDAARATINVDFVFKDVILNGNEIMCQFWDTAGLERFYALNSNYFRDSHAFVFVFDLGRKQTLNALEQWIKSVKNSVGDEHFEKSVIYVIGNKCDLGTNEKSHEQRTVLETDVRDFLKNKLDSYTYVETSAKTGKNVTTSLMNIVGQIPMDSAIIRKNTTNGDLNIEDAHTKSSNCCLW